MNTQILIQLLYLSSSLSAKLCHKTNSNFRPDQTLFFPPWTNGLRHLRIIDTLSHWIRTEHCNKLQMVLVLYGLSLL